MSSNAMVSEGVILKRGDGGAPETFTEVSEVVSFDGPGGTAAVIDVTHLRSSAKEKRIGLPDEGQIKLEMNYVPSDSMQAALRSDRVTRTRRNFKLLMTDTGPTTASFAAYVLEFSVKGGVDQKIAASITLEIDGTVTWA